MIKFIHVDDKNKQCELAVPPQKCTPHHAIFKIRRPLCNYTLHTYFDAFCFTAFVGRCVDLIATVRGASTALSLILHKWADGTIPPRVSERYQPAWPAEMHQRTLL